MKPAPAAGRLRRLAPLTVAVLAAHLLLLQPADQALAPAPRTDSSIPFTTRSVPSPAQAPPVTTAAPPAPPAPAAADRPRPAPPRRPAPAAAPTPAADPSLPAPAPAPAREPAPREPTGVAAPAPPAAAQLPVPPPLPPAAAPPLPAARERSFAIPPAMHLHYELTAHWRGLPLRGRAELVWQHDGQKYEARFVASSLGRQRQQRSTGRITPQGLAPDYFWEKSRNEQAAHFERDRGQVVFSNNRPRAPIVAGLQDRLSVVLQLAAMVAGQPADFAPGAHVTVPTAGTGDAENWTFTVEGEEDLQLPGGPVRALKLQRLPRKEYDQGVELWLAASMDYAPVRLRLTNPNGDAVDQRWSSTDR